MNKSIIYEQITSISVLARQLPQSLHGVLWHGLTFLFIFLLFLLFIVNYLHGEAPTVIGLYLACIEQLLTFVVIVRVYNY